MKIILVVLVAFMLLNYSCGKKEDFAKKGGKRRLLNKVLKQLCRYDIKNKNVTNKEYCIKKPKKYKINKFIKDTCNYINDSGKIYKKFRKNNKNFKKLCKN